MEGSEDDAGAATSASRGTSAREKEFSGTEDGAASQEAARAAAAEATSASECDIDSVPSPSAQDINTSTEALLDMIDEIVDGPDAVKRRSNSTEITETCSPSAETSSNTDKGNTEGEQEQISEPQPSYPSVAESEQSENIPLDRTAQPQTEPTGQCYAEESESKQDVESTQASSSEPISSEVESTLPQDSAVINMEPEALIECPPSEVLDTGPETSNICPPTDSAVLSVEPDASNNSSQSNSAVINTETEISACPASNIPSSSMMEPVQCVSDTNETDMCERTVKSVSSSDNQDIATVESAEPSSSDSSVSEGSNRLMAEPAMRTPLRRRLVRPSLSDRRPDSTVSSTVDSHTENVHTISHSPTESIAKDVSSSSDAVPSVQGNTKPEEIRDIREISFCKAETSGSPSKKIKLVRQKLAPVPLSREFSAEDTSERDQCQSTSSESISSVIPEPNKLNVTDEMKLKEEANAIAMDQSMKDAPDITLDVVPMARPLIPTPDNTTNVDVPGQSEIRKNVVSGNQPASPTPVVTTNVVVSGQSPIEVVPIEGESTTAVVAAGQLVLPEITTDCTKVKSQVNEENVTDTKCAVPSSKTEREICDDMTVPPIKIHLTSSTSESSTTETKIDNEQRQSRFNTAAPENKLDPLKSVPKLTIKLGNKQLEDMKSPIPKLTIKPIRQPKNEQEIVKATEQIPAVTKLNIKPVIKPPEKVNDVHRKSSSSEISESESSENDESNSTSDQTSTSDQGPSDVVPKVTIKLGKPGTESEGKFYTEQNAPKITIKGIQSSAIQEQESVSKLKLVISQPEDKLNEKLPKLTIKTVAKSDGQPLSPKLTIKPLKHPEEVSREGSSERPENTSDIKENTHIPKITIKPVIKSDSDGMPKTPRKSTIDCGSSDQIPVVTKLNIKPVVKPKNIPETLESLEEKVPIVSRINIKHIMKPTECCDTVESEDRPVVPKLHIKPVVKPANAEKSEKMDDNVPVISKLNIKPLLKPTDFEETSECTSDKVPVVSKLNIKPIIKPKDNDIESSIHNVPKITKLNIKPIRNPEEDMDCDLNTDKEINCIPTVTKLNIKPLVKPAEEEVKDSENQSSETGNSSDENTDDIPAVTKLNIKPILRPSESEESQYDVSNEESIPVVSKLNIKPLIKPEEIPSSPKREGLRSDFKTNIPTVTKLNIKPVLKPDDHESQRSKNVNEEISSKNPPLVMKINMKTMSEISDAKNSSIEGSIQHPCNNISETEPMGTKLNMKPLTKQSELTPLEGPVQSSDKVVNCKPTSSHGQKSSTSETLKQNSSPAEIKETIPTEDKTIKISIVCDHKEAKDLSPNTLEDIKVNKTGHVNESIVVANLNTISATESGLHTGSRQMTSVQNCTLLKKLLETKKDGLDTRLEENVITANHLPVQRIEESKKEPFNYEQSKLKDTKSDDSSKEVIQTQESQNEVNSPTKDPDEQVSDSFSKPLEINTSEKVTNQSSGQDSPRIILKINKTDHGPSAKIITEETKRPESPKQNEASENTQEMVNDKTTQKKIVNSRKKQISEVTPDISMGKRLRSSRIVETPEKTEKTPIAKRNTGKRTSTTEEISTQSKETELTVLETKRLKLGQLLSNKSLTITPVQAKPMEVSVTKSSLDIRQGGKIINHTILNNENCAKNGNSKLHNILSNLQAKQAQALTLKEINNSENKNLNVELESNTSTCSSDVVEVPVTNSHTEVSTLIITDSSESRDIIPDEVSQDPLEETMTKVNNDPEKPSVPRPVEMTPQPKKRGRPRKLPVSEGAKPLPSPEIKPLPVPALVERPQRSLRLYRDRPAILVKPRGRGRGRGRGARAAPPPAPAPAPQPEPPPPPEPTPEAAARLFGDESDPTSSRVKLPRMTEALDACATPLSSRRRESATPELKVVLENTLKLEAVEAASGPGRGGGRGGRGSRGGRGRGGRPPRARGRGRGGGRGAVYMKETMGIYGRVCGPATTTVQLFEEETCMMDDNATPAKSSHLLDEDSQSSFKSSTNESSKMKKSKFEDLFDSNKVWTAADVKEYVWPPPEKPDVERQVMMIQEQVAMFLGVKGFRRRYPELKRRPVAGEERDYVITRGLLTEALCDLGVTAVDASEVLDIMLSDYPHKYEEYRSYQRKRQIAEASEETQEAKPEARVDRVEMKIESKPETKPEPPKVDLEKSRQDMAAAAIASASEFNSRLNALRRPACVDLQSYTVQRRRPAAAGGAGGAGGAAGAAVREHVAPPAGFYPHALLPGQYQHTYRVYTPEQLRYFPLNTALAAPPAPVSPPPSSSDSEGDWPTDCSSDRSSDRPAKRKKLTKSKRSSQADAGAAKEEAGEVELCRACRLRLEANRKYTHERFLVCASCNAKLHPGCVELGADTIRKCREYAWQCAECKTCCACARPADDDKMLFCDLCDRGHHIYCVGLAAVPQGRWHCVECAVCKSCGARDPNGPPAAAPGTPGTPGTSGAPSTPASTSGVSSAPGTPQGSVSVAGGGQWHHQTKRGPGGHKVYSHSLCTPCARAYRIGRYCPLCDRSFIGPKGTMQLVICKLCDRQHHQDCVRQTVSQLNVLDYTCGECRRGGITSRSAAARLAPRTIATLFMAKRRFNKYAHRQYMQSRLQQAKPSETTDTADTADGYNDAAVEAESCDALSEHESEMECVEPESVDGVEADAEAEAEGVEPSDPLEGVGDPPPPLDEAAAAVEALRMDFGD